MNDGPLWFRRLREGSWTVRFNWSLGNFNNNAFYVLRQAYCYKSKYSLFVKLQCKWVIIYKCGITSRIFLHWIVTLISQEALSWRVRGKRNDQTLVPPFQIGPDTWRSASTGGRSGMRSPPSYSPFCRVKKIEISWSVLLLYNIRLLLRNDST